MRGEEEMKCGRFIDSGKTVELDSICTMNFVGSKKNEQ